MTDPVTMRGRAEKAAQYFQDHAHEHGQLTAACKGLEHKRHVVLAMEEQRLLKANPKKSMAAIKSEALTSQTYAAHLGKIEDAWADKTTLETLFESGRMFYGIFKTEGSI